MSNFTPRSIAAHVSGSGFLSRPRMLPAVPLTVREDVAVVHQVEYILDDRRGLAEVHHESRPRETGCLACQFHGCDAKIAAVILAGEHLDAETEA